MSIDNLFKFVIQDKGIIKRILITAAIILFVRAIYFIPIPGVYISSIVEIYQSQVASFGGTMFDMLTLLHVGKLRGVSLFALGLMPFINACVIIQIIGFLIPGVNRRFFYHPGGRALMWRVTILVAVALSLIHAYSISGDLELMNKFSGIQLLSLEGVIFRLGVMVSMSAAFGLLMFLAGIINRFGLGHGVGILFASEILIRVILAMVQAVEFYSHNIISGQQLALYFLVFLIFVFVVKKITEFAKNIELQTASNKKFSITIRAAWLGVWPLLITEVFCSFFEVQVKWHSLVMISMCIAFFALLYAKIIYQPRRFYELMLPYKCVMCKDQKKRLVDVLNASVLPCLGMSFALFLMLYYIPVSLPFILKISYLSAGIFGVFGVIILVGVCFDITEQLRFFRNVKQKHADIIQWRLLGIARDETEAEVKKACLSGQGIVCEIKPSHFSWGVPIRTAASAYYMMVPADMRKEAALILKQLKEKWQDNLV